jgi:hypothetical protein
MNQVTIAPNLPIGLKGAPVRCIDAEVTWSSLHSSWHPTEGEVYLAVMYDAHHVYIRDQSGVPRGIWFSYRFVSLAN